MKARGVMTADPDDKPGDIGQSPVWGQAAPS